MKQFKSDNRTYRFDHRIKPIEIRDRQQEYQHVSKYGQVDFKIHAYRNVNMQNENVEFVSNVDTLPSFRK
jgi:type VI protein secretion system component VasA